MHRHHVKRRAQSRFRNYKQDCCEFPALFSMRLPPTFAGKRLCGSAPTIKNAPLYFVQPALHSARNYSPSAQTSSVFANQSMIRTGSTLESQTQLPQFLA